MLHEYTKFAGAYGLIAGQVVDIESEGGKLVKSPEETLKFIHLNKTAVLFRLAMRTGAIIAEADDKQIEELDRLATEFGLAFQMYDDIMDEISTFEEMGKTIVLVTHEEDIAEYCKRIVRLYKLNFKY